MFKNTPPQNTESKHRVPKIQADDHLQDYTDALALSNQPSGESERRGLLFASNKGKLIFKIWPIDIFW